MKSTLAPNKRYLLVGVESERPLEYNAVRNEISKHLDAYFGVEGQAQVQARILDKLGNEKELVIRAARGTEMRVVAGLALMGKINGVNVHAKVARISGTIKGLGLEGNEEG